MTVRRVHRLMGIVMLLPLVGWAATGLVFFVKPGYADAYESLPIRSYAIESPITIVPRPGWREFRVVRTVLGTHVLARTDEGWRHFGTDAHAPMPPPTADQVRTLIDDALTGRAGRYGRVRVVHGATAETDTGARVTLDWDRLTLQQRGRDTDRIDALYRVHYLQWTGIGVVDKVLGFAGLAMIISLTALGARLAFRR